MTVRRQHYVWRHYIEAWANKRGLVHCLRHGKDCFLVNPTNVMVERDFYKLHQLDTHDIDYLNDYIENSGPSDLKQHFQDFAALIALIANGNALIQSDGRFSAAEKEEAMRSSIEAEEKLHADIENKVLPILNELRSSRSEFINSNELSAIFFQFVAQQYCRTKNIRDDVRTFLSQDKLGRDLSKLTNVMCYIWATTMAFNLFHIDHDFDIVFLENRGNLGFVTGDQPLINILANRYDGDTTGTTFYYPLSPNLSCLVVPKRFKLQSKHISDIIVEELNGFIAWHSSHFVVGDSNTAVQRAIEKRPFPNQSARALLDRIARIT